MVLECKRKRGRHSKGFKGRKEAGTNGLWQRRTAGNGSLVCTKGYRPEVSLDHPTPPAWARESWSPPTEQIHLTDVPGLESDG